MIMNKRLQIIAAAFALFAIASCDRTDPFLGENLEDGAFVTFSCNPYATCSEDAGTFKLPVRVLGDHDAFSATVTAIDGTAKNSTHFKIAEPATGVLEFSAEDSLKFVTFNIIKIDGYVEPGSVEFQIALESATGGVSLGSRRTVDVRINDADHPLSDLLGAWDVKAYDAQSNSTYAEVNYVMNLKAYEGDVTRVWCDGINSFAQSMKGYGFTIVDVYGIVSDDHNTISFPCGQEGGDLGASNGGIVKLVSGYINNGYYVNDELEAIVFTKQDDGTFRCDDGILWLNDYVWPTYGGYFLGKENGVFTSWTKQ